MITQPTTSEVYDFLRSLFQNITYPTISYEPATKVRIVGAAQAPVALELNEVSSGFEISRTNRRDDKLDHVRWMWEVRIAFQKETDFSDLRAALQDVPRLGANTRIKTERAVYTHPVRQEPNNGSRAEFLLNVLLHPV